MVVTHDKAFKQGCYQSSALPLAAALGKRLKVTTYGKAFRQGHYLPLKTALNHLFIMFCRNPTLAKCRGESQHSQSWGLGVLRDSESSGTPECLGFDSKAQNTLHWGVLGVIGKVLKRRYRKWPRIGHLDICRPSYGQKKGRESNWQFDSRPLKVENRSLPDLRMESATWSWKDLDEGYKFGSDLVAIRLCSQEL
jgi:hypothetical protein